jgi:hypothetical protein
MSSTTFSKHLDTSIKQYVTIVRDLPTALQHSAVHISVHTLVLLLQTCSLILMSPAQLKACLCTHLSYFLRLRIAIVLNCCVLLLQVELYIVIMSLFAAVCRLLYKLLCKPGALLLQVLEVRSCNSLCC